jgi:exodeoxyribonuclease V beta subunit
MDKLNKMQTTETELVVQPLNALTFPLYGQRLIEASAGTGKTYTIASLFIRLLLGHGDQAAHQRPLTVDQILVVTFTEAATAELRTRIRERIQDVRLDFIQGQSDDPFTQSLLKEVLDHQVAIRLLRFAELQMDEAAIFTIHGFCQRMLMQNAFESGSLFQQNLLEDDAQLLRLACNDFWRTFFYDLSTPLTELIFSYWESPEQLQKNLRPFLSRSDLHFLPKINDFDFKAKYERSIFAIETLKINWLNDQADYSDIITHSAVSKRSYSKKHLPNWLKEVSEWALTSSSSLSLPKNLVKFSQKILDEKTPKGEVPKHPVFSEIENLLALDLSLENTILVKATQWVQAHLQSNKNKQMLLGFDDLLTRLDAALQNSNENSLALNIRTAYPIALIDEFQDTDPVQYRIFTTIYQTLEGDHSEPLDKCLGLFMIGDPKQAIYSFRGADIFTYMKARRHVSAHYSLDYNYRSTPEMINASNTFFEFCPAPFIYNDDIPFSAVQAPDISRKKLVVENSDDPAQSALQLIHPVGGENIQGFKDSITHACINEIKKVLLLAQQDKAYLEDKNGTRTAITANHIAVLVRTGKEAQLIRNALFNENINSVYLSLKESVYATSHAKDLLRILQACLNPENERLLRAAIACKLFCQTPYQVHEILLNTRLWEEKIGQFIEYRRLWKSVGVLAMLHKLFHQQEISAYLLKNTQGERLLTDVLHLAELLQKNSVDHDGEFALLRWFSEQIKQGSSGESEQKQRLESEKDLVQVSTLHKAKGLQYDIVFMPFTGLYQKPQACLYHDPDQNNALIFDLQNARNNVVLAEKEQLAEDLRLLYVGLTRSVYRCYIGIGNYRKGREKNSPLCKSALGYICLQGGRDLLAGDTEQLNKQLQKMVNNSQNITIRPTPLLDETPYQALKNEQPLQAPLVLAKQIERNWWISSYSSLSRFNTQATASVTPVVTPLVTTMDISKEQTEVLPAPLTIPEKTPFSFPRGAKHGTFLHELFELINLENMETETLNELLFEQLLLRHYPEPELWAPVLTTWIKKILGHDLAAGADIKLGDLSARQKKIEMQFFIPMQELQANEVNSLLKKHDPLSARAGDLQFRTVQGFLKGFIDLTFEKNGKYYVLDYKSNHLGDCLQDYNQTRMEQALIEHRYDFQYQLYTLALHRLLKSRLADYDYETHVGGVFYTFLRGMQGEQEVGVYFVKPSFSLIDGLDKLFSGQKHNTKSSEPIC